MQKSKKKKKPVWKHIRNHGCWASNTTRAEVTSIMLASSMCISLSPFAICFYYVGIVPCVSHYLQLTTITLYTVFICMFGDVALRITYVHGVHMHAWSCCLKEGAFFWVLYIYLLYQMSFVLACLYSNSVSECLSRG